MKNQIETKSNSTRPISKLLGSENEIDPDPIPDGSMPTNTTFKYIYIWSRSKVLTRI